MGAPFEHPQNGARIALVGRSPERPSAAPTENSSPNISAGTLRVAQWATGNIGARALRAVIEHLKLTLGAVYVHCADKAGTDAGDLCGRPATGVAASRTKGDRRRRCRLCPLHAAGLRNRRRVPASRIRNRHRHHPRRVPPPGEHGLRHPHSSRSGMRDRRRLLHSTGSSTGFITEALPLVLTSIQRRLDHRAIDEYADLSQRDSPGLPFDVMGFGSDPAEVEQHRIDHLRASFGPSLRLPADGLGLPLDDVVASGELSVACRAITVATGEIGTPRSRATRGGRHRTPKRRHPVRVTRGPFRPIHFPTRQRCV